MQIVLIRHAHAVSEGAGLPDDHRYLSASGRAAARELGARLAEAGITIGAVLSSPLVRAIQTAELVAGQIGWSGAIEATYRLAPGASLRAAQVYLEERAIELPARSAVLAFGHEPTISALAELLGQDEHVGAFRTAEACLVEDGVLCWRLTSA